MTQCFIINFVLPFFQAAEGLFLKSNFEYLRQNFRKSIKLLNSAPKPNNVMERGESVSTMYYNNLGCIHCQMHKYNLAALYFRRALEENNKALSLLPPVDKSRFLQSYISQCSLRPFTQTPAAQPHENTHSSILSEFFK